MKVAYLFPGQGAQYVGMAKDLCLASPQAKLIFDEADRVLGFSLSKLCFEGPFEELTKTENCQPAVVTASIAALEAWKAISPRLTPPSYVAGLSLGEYSALVAAGVLRFNDAVRLVRKRGEFMEAAAAKNPGGMLCILGLGPDAVRVICQATGCEIANLNCPGQVVVSGSKENLCKASEAASAKGAKRSIALDVSGAFHSSLMDEAAARLKDEIEQVKFGAASCPLISNVDAKPQTDPGVIKSNLIKQVNSTTFWEASMSYLLKEGVGDFFEIGPGSVLKGLFKKINAQVTVATIGKWSDLQDREEGICN
ncbi:MAG: ACP S-malonyltransferase [Candidatus Omnitrophota bacterium]